MEKESAPLLTLLSYESLDGKLEDALPAALAIEMVHTYSLVHDDLPCMDDDDLRRGRPTVHKVFDEAIALLAGDALLTDSFTMLSSSVGNSTGIIESVKSLSKAAGGMGMVAGQDSDMFWTGKQATPNRTSWIFIAEKPEP